MPTYPARVECPFEDLLLSLPLNAARTHLNTHSLVKLAKSQDFKKLFAQACNEMSCFFGRQLLDVQHGEGSAERLASIFLYYASHDDVAALHKSRHTLVYLCNRARDVVQFLVQLCHMYVPMGKRIARVRTIQFGGSGSHALFQSMGHARVCYLLTIFSLFAAEQKADLNARVTRYSLSEQFERGEEPSEVNIHSLQGNLEVRTAEYALEYVTKGISKMLEASSGCVFKSRAEADDFVTNFVNYVGLCMGMFFRLVNRTGLREAQAYRLSLALLRVSQLSTGRLCAPGSPEGEYEDHTARNFCEQFLNVSSILKHGVMSESVFFDGTVDLDIVRSGKSNVFGFFQLGIQLLYQLCDSAVLHVDAVSICKKAGNAGVLYCSHVGILHCSHAPGDPDHRICLDAYAPALYSKEEQAEKANDDYCEPCQDKVELFLS